MAGSRRTGYRTRFSRFAGLAACVAAAMPAPKHTTICAQDWTAVPAFRIGEMPGREGALQSIRSMSVSRDGSRVFLIESVSLRPLVRRVQVWTPDGTLIAEPGAAGEVATFGDPVGMQVAPDGFWVRYPAGHAKFSNDGVPLETVESPFLDRADVRGLLEDHSMFALGRLPPPTVSLGWTGAEPVWHTQVLHVEKSDGEWNSEPIATVGWRNYWLGVRTDDGRVRPDPRGFFRGQPFPNRDLVYFNASAGTVGIVIRDQGPGEVLIHEIRPDGDTIWHRELFLPPVTQPAQENENAIQDVVQRILETAGTSVPDSAARAAARQKAIDALYLPAHRPAVYQATPAVSGELWLRSAETIDSLAVWYVMQHGESTRQPRRVLLPDWFRLRDATSTHVWGFRSYPEGGSQILGLQLVPP